MNVIRADGLLARLRFFGPRAKWRPGERGLVVREGGKVCARAVVGRARGEGTGYVTRLFLAPGERAAKVLTEAIRGELRAMGLSRAAGPLADDLSGFGNGLRASGFEGENTPLEADNPAWLPELLEKNGWEKRTDMLFYRVRRADVPWAFYERAAARARARYGYTVRFLSDMSRREAYELLLPMYRAVEPTDAQALASTLDRYFAAMGESALAMQSGACVGALIVLREGETRRAACLHVHPRARNHGVTALLFDALNVKIPPEIREIQAGGIDEDNAYSKLNAEHTGATLFRTYRVYQLKV